jgi:D-threo-aldose 1-dehydrogenase
VTRLGIGTVPLGNMLGPVSDEDAAAAVRRALELGIRLFDTAPQYGSGLAERRLGGVLAEAPRDDFVISTKVGRVLMRTSTAGKVRRVLRQAITGGPRAGARLIWHNAMGVARRATGRDHTFPLGFPFERGEQALEPVFDFSYDGVMRSFSSSLERTGLDRVDLLYIHDPDAHYDDALRGAFRALDRLRDERVVGAIGVGMNHSAMLTRFAREAAFDCFLLAGRYTLLDQSGLGDLLPACEELGITVNVGGVFNSGILADPRPGATFHYQAVDAADEALGRALAMQEVCARHGVPLAAAALQFPTGHPAVGAVIVGVRSAAEVEENVRLFSWPIPEALWDELKETGLLAADLPVPAAQPMA